MTGGRKERRSSKPKQIMRGVQKILYRREERKEREDKYKGDQSLWAKHTK